MPASCVCRQMVVAESECLRVCGATGVYSYAGGRQTCGLVGLYGGVQCSWVGAVGVGWWCGRQGLVVKRCDPRPADA